MARLEIEDFEDRELVRVYTAGRFSEAQRVEELLNEAGIDYSVDVERFYLWVLGLFRSEYVGVGFYVLLAQEPRAKKLLSEAGLRTGLEPDSPSTGENETS